MNNGNLYDTNPDNASKGYTIVIGTTGYGKSVLPHGVLIEPSEEELKAEKAERDKDQEKERLRSQAMKQAYIEQGGDLTFIEELLQAADLVPFGNTVPDEKLQQILFILDDHLFFQGLAWGFTDTEIQSELGGWVDENQESIKQIYN